MTRMHLSRHCARILDRFLLGCFKGFAIYNLYRILLELLWRILFQKKSPGDSNSSESVFSSSTRALRLCEALDILTATHRNLKRGTS